MAKYMKKNIVLISISALLTSFGQFFWKISNCSNIISLITGFLLYGLGAISMIYAFKFGELSKTQPTLSISYVFSLIIGYTFLKEPIDLLKIIGILLILTGVIIIGKTNE